MAESPQQKSRSTLRLILSILLMAILLSAGIILYAGWLDYQESPKLIEVDDPGTSSAESYTLSSDQESSQLAYGDPEGFTILFYEEESPTQGIQTVRLETWEYYTQGIGLTFINGELTAQDPLEVGEIDSMDLLPYSPELFTAYMSLDEVISAAGFESYIEIPVEDDFIQDGVLYYAKSLSFGLKDDQLIYIEAIALTSE